MVTSIILTGGESSRLRRNKALELIGGRSLIQRVVERLVSISKQNLVVGSPSQFSFLSGYDVEYKADLYPGKGPLGGIYTGLAASKSLYNLVVACDMPFLNIELLRHLMKFSPGFDAVVPKVERIQPLHAVYCKSCLDGIRTQLENNQLGVTQFLGTVNVRYVDQAECQRIDPQLLSFFNINSQADLARANMLAKENIDSRSEDSCNTN
jgi:molybdopterin-guanine dinucleotide biosynthesis protein A